MKNILKFTLQTILAINFTLPIYGMEQNTTTTTMTSPGTHHEFVCPFEGCGKSFTQKGNLMRHQRIHIGEKPYVCQVDGCGKSFTQQGNLERHQRLHIGEKPYVCQVDGCGKSFADKSNLTRHQRTHFGKKPCICLFDGCGKSFADESNLKRYERKHAKFNQSRKRTYSTAFNDMHNTCSIQEENNRNELSVLPERLQLSTSVETNQNNSTNLLTLIPEKHISEEDNVVVNQVPILENMDKHDQNNKLLVLPEAPILPTPDENIKKNSVNIATTISKKDISNKNYSESEDELFEKVSRLFEATEKMNSGTSSLSTEIMQFLEQYEKAQHDKSFNIENV